MIDVIREIVEAESIDRAFLIDCVRKIGLENDSRPIYGTESIYMRPDGMVWQLPEQFADFLLFLSNYQIKTFLEVGTWKGASSSMLSAYLKLENALTIDIQNKFHLLEEVQKLIKIDFQIGTSDDFRGRHFDLCFIDGNHSYEWVKRDYENVGQYCGICAFHDIVDPWCPGVVQFWNEIKSQHKHIEFIQNGTLGIGLLYSHV
jgi:hypothetical protein